MIKKNETMRLSQRVIHGSIHAQVMVPVSLYDSVSFSHSVIGFESSTMQRTKRDESIDESTDCPPLVSERDIGSRHGLRALHEYGIQCATFQTEAGERKRGGRLATETRWIMNHTRMLKR